MFSFLTRLLAKKKSDRRIFRYFNGIEWVGADPTLLNIALLSHPEYIDAKHPMESTKEALGICYTTYLEIFKLHAWDGKRGLTLEDVMQVYLQFVNYCERLKKNTSSSQKSPESSESTSETSTTVTSSASPDSTSTAVSYTHLTLPTKA